MLKKFFASLSLLLTLCIFSLILIVGGSDPAESAQPNTSPPMLAAAGMLSGQDILTLSAHFGAPVPYLSLTGNGRVEDTAYAGGYARKLSWTDSTGLTVACVRPKDAAQLLQPGNLTIDASQTCQIYGRTAMLATDSQGSYLFFSDELAAYCLYMNDSPGTLLALIDTLQFTN